MAFAVLLLTGAGPAPASPLTYDYLELGPVKVRPDAPGFEADGMGFALSRTRPEGGFITAGISRVETDTLVVPDIIPVINDFTGTLVTTTISAGAGAHSALNERTDLVFGVSLLFTKVQGDGRNSEVVAEEDIGLAGNIGVRSALTERVEGSIGAGYTMIFDEGNASLALGAAVRVTPRIAIRIGADLGEDTRVYAAGIRYRF